MQIFTPSSSRSKVPVSKVPVSKVDTVSSSSSNVMRVMEDPEACSDPVDLTPAVADILAATSSSLTHTYSSLRD
eukprot:CAMPEP_0173245784 /NCGR_PEP_ID=MMETSP1142-20121109/16944_1 /TAXON_ID=483371 /ORGANISM="non described non described, Strain CCMP2298" /LENGTH=73 /DNA_ID=CAMNT_0014177915 /DNA_START=118 /DNA_END=339 /DNA_ORIENTATION=+